MIGIVLFLHALVSILLIVAILMQSGRGGGLTESFASAESMFGAQTNEFMIKTTTVLATVFFVTCIGLAILSSQSGRSLMSNKVAPETPVALPEPTVDVVVGEQETRPEVPEDVLNENSEGPATEPEKVPAFDVPPEDVPIPTVPETQ
jgi:preprotein translocase subunit SecG